jgi:hypothetical protein
MKLRSSKLWVKMSIALLKSKYKESVCSCVLTEGTAISTQISRGGIMFAKVMIKSVLKRL